MRAARNQRFRIAAALVAAAYLIYAAGEIVEADRIFGFPLSAGYGISAVIFAVVRLVGAVGWALIALGFGKEIDWARLRLGATIVAAALIGYIVAFVLLKAMEVGDAHGTQIRLSFLFATLDAMLTALAACAFVAGLAESRRGPTRGRWLRSVAILVAAAFGASILAQLFLQAYWSDLGVPREFTIGAIVVAVGSLGLLVGAGVFARGAQRPLAGREASLVGAAVISVASALCLVGGEALIAVGYGQADETSLSVALWLGVAGRLVSAAAIVAIALGARAVTRGEFAVSHTYRG